MFDANHLINGFGPRFPTGNMDVQTYMGPVTTTVIQWQTWRKPRGAKMVYMIAVGAGSSGGCGLNTGTTSGGGAGGGSGAMSYCAIPAVLLPDELFVQAGNGGRQPATLVSAAVGVAGIPSYVCLEPTSLVAQLTVLFANAGAATGTAATTTAGGAAGTAAAVATIANMPFAGRGFYQFLAGAAGAAGGGSTAAGASLTTPFQTGLPVTGGAGGGGASATPGAGGTISHPFSMGSVFINNYAAAAASSGATPAARGSIIQPHKFNMFYGGFGGGGGNQTAGGAAGAGGDGGPGCGGGGAGGATTTNATLARPGDGGPGYVIIASY